ncbi:MAG: hypothetical protein R2911_39640 [Caldilineaceae bacterium]
MQTIGEDKERVGSANWRPKLQPPSLPRPSALWRAYRDMAAFKRLLLARLITWQQTGHHHLRSRLGELAPVQAGAESLAPVDEWRHAAHQEQENADRQMAHQGRHSSQTAHGHQDFSSRFRER